MQTEPTTRNETPALPPHGSRRASIGRVLVALAVFAPAAVVLGVYLFLQGRLYGYHVPGPKWPWIAVDLAVLLTGVLLMRGEDL